MNFTGGYVEDLGELERKTGINTIVFHWMHMQKFQK